MVKHLSKMMFPASPGFPVARSLCKPFASRWPMDVSRTWRIRHRDLGDLGIRHQKWPLPQDFEKFWSEHGEASKAAWHHGKTISVYSIGWQLVHGLALWVNMC